MNSGISPLRRDKRGRRIHNKPKGAPGNPGTIWRRLRGKNDNWEDLEKAGINPDFGTIVGKLYLHRIITASQASALRLYAEVVGRYDRFFSDAVLKRTVASPAYQRGSHGQDDELEKRIKNGTINQYERMANRARKAHAKLQGCIPTDAAREMIERICIYDTEIESVYHQDLVLILDRIVSKFGLRRE